MNDILDDLDGLAGDESDVSLGDVTERIGPRGTGTLLLIPGLIGVTPVGGVPGVPTVLGVFTVLIAVQTVMGRSQVWLPGILRRRSVTDDKLSGAVEKLRGTARWIDRYFGNRLEALAGPPASRIAALLCVALGAMLPPLELVPFAALIPFAAIAILGLALTLRDGVLMALGFAVGAGACYVTVTALL